MFEYDSETKYPGFEETHYNLSKSSKRKKSEQVKQQIYADLLLR